jgi:hypothetical protein
MRLFDPDIRPNGTVNLSSMKCRKARRVECLLSQRRDYAAIATPVTSAHTANAS